jgi:voltage-gated sodium channel
MISTKLRQLTETRWFQWGIIAVILFNAVLIGVETDEGLVARNSGLMHALNWVVQAIFIAELVVRIGAFGRRPLQFFRDGWNVFDFAVVVISLLPAAGPAATVVRLARILRVVRLVSVSPGLRLLVSTLLRSIPSMGHVVVLLSLLIYTYGVLGCYLFRHIDPATWGTLSRSLLSTFQMLTLEGWVEMQGAVIAKMPYAWIYFGSFIIVAVFLVVNLFIAVVLNNLETVKDEELARAAEEERAARDPLDYADSDDELLMRLRGLRTELDAIESALERRKITAAKIKIAARGE